MKKKLICLFITITMLIPNFTSVSYSLSPFYNSSNLNDIKGKDNLVKNLLEVERIRGNINTLNINSNSSNNDLEQASKFIDFYITELSNVRNSFETHLKTYKNSDADVFIADASIYIIQCYTLGLRETKFLIHNLKEGKVDNVNIFYSQQNSIMYYYFMQGDLQLSCFEAFLIKK